ncbi:MAG: AAA family ATPase, partial [Candidatus Binatus sp.]
MGEKEEAAERGAQQNAFIGRTRELSELRGALEESLAGRGSCFLISGEPGIGKTSLADELAADAASRGVRVAWGRCWEGGGAPAYWPWVEIVRALVLEPGRARPQQTAVPPEIGQLIPELAAETTQQRSSSDPEQGRFRLFDAVATLVKRVARSTPVVLILDDLHEADRGSLELLKFVARGLTDSRVVIVGTYRDAEVRRSTYLAESISEIVRHGHPMPLAGMAENEVAQMIEHRAERSPSATFASELHRVTAGNPLFVDGVIRVLLAERKLGMAEHLDLSGFKLPEGVRGAIRKRLALLSAEARSALAVAAVIGQEFDVVLLERVNQESAGTLAELMREAAEVGIVAATSRETYRFTHPLIREALYGDSTDAERGRRHLMVADALEEMHAANLRPHLAALAHHFREAAIVEKAIDYSIRAGDASYAVFAYEEAASHWEATLQLMATHTGGDLERQADVLWRLGDELVSGPRAIGHLEAAGLLYEQLDNQEMTGEVHSRLGHYFSAPDLGVTDMSRSMFHFQKAETLLANQPESFAYADLCVQKAAACIWARRTSDGLSSARRAMDIAERTGNGSVWALGAIVSSLFLILTGSVAEGVELANQTRRRAESINGTYVGAGVARTGGGNHLLLRDPREAQLWFSSELARPRTAQSARFRPMLLGQMVVACAWTGELAEARRYLAELGARNSPYLLHCDGEWEEEEKALSRSCMQAHVKGDIYYESLHLRDLGES